MAVLPDIDFKSIRPHAGSINSGFEEFSVQLFRAEHDYPDEFYRVDGAGGDGGVEAFFQTEDGDEIGIQAKMFSQLKETQFRQINASVLTALSKYPKLKRYYVAAPLDRSKLQVAEWKESVAKWKQVATANGNRGFKVVWWGASELKHLLTNTEHETRLRFWFGNEKFNREWLDRVNAAATKDLDTRYTPQLHIRVRGSVYLDAFVRDDRFRCLIERRAASLGASIRGIADIHFENAPEVSAAHHQFREAWECVIAALYQIEKQIPPIDPVLQSCETVRNCLDALTLAIERRTNDEKDTNDSIRKADETAREISSFTSFLENYHGCEKQFLLLAGDAGSGKSHLMAQAIQEAQATGRSALLMLGEHFGTAEDPWSQLLAKLCWEGSVEDLLACLQASAETSSTPSLLVVDAVNESERRVWKSHINSFSEALKPFPLVKLVITCRSDFLQLSLPPTLAQSKDSAWGYFHHTGFGSNLFRAVSTYLTGYRVKTEHFPPLMPELANPLYLKTLCEAFEGQSLPAGPLGFQRVMQARITRLTELLLAQHDIPKVKARQAIAALADAFAPGAGKPLPVEHIRSVLDPLSPDQHESKSLYRLLCSNAFLVETGSRTGDDDQILVRFPYERFSDYFLVERMLNLIGKPSPNLSSEGMQKPVRTKKGLIRSSGEFAWLMDPHVAYTYPGLLNMFAILLPERFGIELPHLLKAIGALGYSDDAFIKSLSWRSTASITANTQTLFELVLAEVERSPMPTNNRWAILFAFCSIPRHPFNANYLHAKLSSLKMADRDETWTISMALGEMH